jgi:hypothetical protein
MGADHRRRARTRTWSQANNGSGGNCRDVTGQAQRLHGAMPVGIFKDSLLRSMQGTGYHQSARQP